MPSEDPETLPELTGNDTKKNSPTSSPPHPAQRAHT